MAAHKSVKGMATPSLQQAPRCATATVGVIISRADLHFAIRMRRLPDLFELRLDHLAGLLDELENKLPLLGAPLIMTARHPREGGANNLPLKERGELLYRFLPWASYIDIELRSAKALRPLLQVARLKKVRCIISFHDFSSTPTARSLRARARMAKLHGADIFKVATRTDTSAQLGRLLDFFNSRDLDLAVSAMGIGKLGAKSRRELTRHGSVLNYGHLGRTRIGGQPSLSEIRRWKSDASHAARCHYHRSRVRP
jgi:3-dehydroquinate dehydratase I